MSVLTVLCAMVPATVRRAWKPRRTGPGRGDQNAAPSLPLPAGELSQQPPAQSHMAQVTRPPRRSRRATGRRSASSRRTSTYAWRMRRAMILARDNRTCQYCGARATEVDHVVPAASGGSDHPSNLVACCFECNRGMNVAIKRQLLEAQGGGGRDPEASVPKLRRHISLPAPEKRSRDW
ncbi:MAG: HNH endonuclease [Thermoleophilia bacterium]